MVFIDWLASVATERSGPRIVNAKVNTNKKPAAESSKQRQNPAANKAQTVKPGDCGQKTAAKDAHTRVYMQPSSTCLTPFQFLGRISSRREDQVNHEKLGRYRAWIHGTIIPKFNRHGAQAVSVAEMEGVIAYLGEFVFWNALARVRFAWNDRLWATKQAFGTTVNGKNIEMDPHSVPPVSGTIGDRFLGVLLHECCHAVFYQHACSGECGSRTCVQAWRTQYGARGGHGPAWVRLARGAQAVVRRHGLFDGYTEHDLYGADRARPP